jgi:hypothetical protein
MNVFNYRKEDENPWSDWTQECVKRIAINTFNLLNLKLMYHCSRKTILSKLNQVNWFIILKIVDIGIDSNFHNNKKKRQQLFWKVENLKYTAQTSFK